MAVDPSFALSETHEAKLYSETETLKNNIMTLFLMRAGSYPSLPFLGIDIIKYLYDMNFNVESLKSEVGRQCSALSSKIASRELDIQKVDMDGYFIIMIVIPAVIQEKRVKYLLGFKSWQTQRRVMDPLYEMEVRTFIQSEA